MNPIFKSAATTLGVILAGFAIVVGYTLPKVEAEPSTETRYLEALKANEFQVMDPEMAVAQVCAGLVMGTPAKLIEEAITYQLDLTDARAGDLVSIAVSVLCPPQRQGVVGT